MEVEYLAFDGLQLLFDYPSHHFRIAFGAKIEDQLVVVCGGCVEIAFYPWLFAVGANCCLEPTGGAAVEDFQMHNRDRRCRKSYDESVDQRPDDQRWRQGYGRNKIATEIEPRKSSFSLRISRIVDLKGRPSRLLRSKKDFIQPLLNTVACFCA